MPSESYIDYAPFVSPQFNVTAYANAILAGEEYHPRASTSTENEESTVASGSGAVKGKGNVGPVTAGKSENGIGPGGSMRLTVKGDVGVALSKLNYGIEDVNKKLRTEIDTHHPSLLAHLSSTTHLSSNLTTIHRSLSSLTSSLDRLHAKIHDPYTTITAQVDRAEKIRGASEVLRRLGRVLVLVRRLEGQMKIVNEGIRAGEKGFVPGKKEKEKEKENGEGLERASSFTKIGMNEKSTRISQSQEEGTDKEREMVKAALTLAELESLLDPASVPANTSDPTPLSPPPTPIPLTSLEIIHLHTPRINASRETLIIEMESMIVRSLAELDQPLLSTSLQTAFNLRLLDRLVGNLLADLNDAVDSRVGRVFDMASIGKEVASKETATAQSAATSLIYRATRTKTDSTPNSSNQALWTITIWRRFELLIEDVANCCIKVYTLEKVLRNKKDPATGLDFLEEAMKTLEERPSFMFWTTLATALDTKCREIMNSNNFLQQTLSQSYPRLLRLLHEFFGKISVHTNTVFTEQHQSPETVLILRSVSKIEQAYLQRSATRMNEAITASFAGGIKQPPTASEGIAIFRVMLNELDSARFDPLMSRSVARSVGKALDGVVGRVDSLLVKDFSATSLIGPAASSAQILNSSLISFLYNLTISLRNALADFPAKVQEILEPNLIALAATYDKPLDSLDVAIKREIGNIIGRIHKVDFSSSVDPMSMGGGNDGSPYIVDLADKLIFLRTDILGRLNLSGRLRAWVTSLTRYTMYTFMLNASIACPLGEMGKLKLTSDMTQLEFALGGFLATGSIAGAGKGGQRLEEAGGEEYRALRAFRTLLFLEPSSLSETQQTTSLPLLIVLHHVIVLSPLLLPHQQYKWSQAEYVAWIGKHTEKESLALVERALQAQEISKQDSDSAVDWRVLLGDVLKQGKLRDS